MREVTKSPQGISSNKVFLGGTCTSDWRDEVIPALDYYEINYFNPVVEDWTPECIELENEEKYEKCNIHLYYIDSSMKGVYSIAELVDSVYRTIEKDWCVECECYHKSTFTDYVIFIINEDEFDKNQIRSLKAVSSMIKNISPLVICDVCNNNNKLNVLLKNIKHITDMDFGNDYWGSEMSDFFGYDNFEDDTDEDDEDDF